MDWSKVDAALAGALADEDEAQARYPVFVHLGNDVDPDAVAACGVGPGEGPVRTATLTAAAIDRLTEQSWVTQVRLSGRLGLADDR